MKATVADQLADAASSTFVGRKPELALLRVGTAETPEFVVAFVHGPGGIGKSRLLSAALDANLAGRPVLRLDCRDVEPTPRGLLRSVATLLGSQPDLDSVLAALSATDRPAIIGLDTYETFGLLDAWIRQVFVPGLSQGVVLMIAGRDRPGAGWLTTPGWAGLVREVHLGPLTDDQAFELLRARGIEGDDADRIADFAHGHPLALELAAAAFNAEPDEPLRLRSPVRAIDQLLQVVLNRLPPRTIATLEAAAMARRVTEPILRALLASGNVHDEFADLRRLPFVEESAEGLLLHDVVRDAVSSDLASRDPEADARYRRRALGFFMGQARRSSAETLWQATADLIYLIRNPVLRDACFPKRGSAHAVEPATLHDDASIREIIAAHEGGDEADLLVRWWEQHPETFSVARAPSGAVDAFVQVARIDRIDLELLAADPVSAACRRHLDDVPPADGEKVLIMRRWLGRETGELMSPAVAACWLDVKRVYMELRPNLSRLYTAMRELEAQSPIFMPLGFARIDGAQISGDRFLEPVWLNFGHGSVDGWLSRLIDAEVESSERELGTESGTSPTDVLSAREIDVLRLIADGLSNRLIGERLFITEKTAGRHVSNIYGKLGVHTRAQATRLAAESGLTTD